MKRFKWHTLGTIAVLFLVHVAAFAAMVVLVIGIQDSITDLNSSGALH